MFIFVSRRQWGTTKYLQVPRSACGALEGAHRPAYVSVVDDRQPQTFRHTRRCRSFPKRNELARSNRQDAGCTTLSKTTRSFPRRTFVCGTYASGVQIVVRGSGSSGTTTNDRRDQHGHVEIHLERSRRTRKPTSLLSDQAQRMLAGIVIHDKVAAIQLQWISRLTSTGDDSWKYFARFWLDRAASPFTEHRGLLSGNRSPVSSAIPPFYLSLLKTYRLFNGADRTSPSTLSEATSQSLFGNPNITDPSGRPFFSLSVATAGLCIVGDLRENNRWKEIGQLQQRYQVGPYFLKGFVRKLHTAIPAVWFTLPDTEATPSLLSIFFPPKTPIPLSSKRMYVQMVKCGDVRPLAEDKWTLPSWSEGWSTACSALRDARLDTHIPTILLSNFSIAFFRLQTV